MIAKKNALLESKSVWDVIAPTVKPVPFAAWYALAGLAEIVPRPPFTRNQVELLQVDTTASNQPGFRELGISPRSLEEELQTMLGPSAGAL